MNISYRWLLSIAPSIHDSPQQLAERLGMLGAPVDELTDLGAGLGDIVVARVAEVRPHPDADRLHLCTVEAGGPPLQVVCGAPNVEAGRFYPFAPVGATLPGGMQIRKAKLRGELSEGMLCSARELGLGREHAGLMTLSGDWEPGSPLVDSLELNDARLVLDVTPNRPDLLSHLGVARELAEGGYADVRLAAFSESPPSLEVTAGGPVVTASGFRVTIEDQGDCSRYMAAVMEGVSIGPSPEWLTTRLRAIGVRPINNVVDATNYVLQELGQPLHAFDFDRVAGPEINVRRARVGESLRTLDGVERPLDANALVIADRERPLALAGLMGGEESEVTAGTTRLLIECALFDPLIVRKMARSMGLSTDASHRFERGVDWRIQPRAVERVVDLIVAVAGGALWTPVLDAHPAPASPTVVKVRPSRVRRVLGIDLEAREIQDLLTPIGFRAEGDEDGMAVEVPPYRPDVIREIDVIEEIARRRGYDSFDAKLGHFRPGNVPADPSLELQRAAHEIFNRWGFLEARTAAFSPASDRRVPLLNPLSAEESHLRDDLLTGLIRRVEHNWAHGVRSIRLYEIGTTFRMSGGPVPEEEVRLAAVFTGPSRPPHWSEQIRAYDLWDLKGLMAEIGEGLADLVDIRARSSDNGILDQDEGFAVVARSGVQLGVGGRVVWRAIDAPKWAEPVWALEFALQVTEGRMGAVFTELPVFPPVDRDLALLVPAGVSASDVERIIRVRAGDLLQAVWPFDLYEGEGVAAGARSIAWRLRFRHPERTLNDADVESPLSQILSGLKEELGVKRR